MKKKTKEELKKDLDLYTNKIGTILGFIRINATIISFDDLEIFNFDCELEYLKQLCKNLISTIGKTYLLRCKITKE